jgi:multidrug resistance efflux pump
MTEQTDSPSSRRIEPRAIIVGVLFVAIIGVAIWYLARPEPLLVQGEVESTRIDIAARVSGRLAKIAVKRGQDVATGAALLQIDKPELVAQLQEAHAEKAVADAELARINAGTRSEIVAQRKAEIDRATADVTLAQQTYGRTRQLTADKYAPQSKLDQDTNALSTAQNRLDQANLAYQEAVRGFTPEEREIAEANVGRAVAKIESVKALVELLNVAIAQGEAQIEPNRMLNHGRRETVPAIGDRKHPRSLWLVGGYGQVINASLRLARAGQQRGTYRWLWRVRLYETVCGPPPHPADASGPFQHRQR